MEDLIHDGNTPARLPIEDTAKTAVHDALLSRLTVSGPSVQAFQGPGPPEQLEGTGPSSTSPGDPLCARGAPVVRSPHSGCGCGGLQSFQGIDGLLQAERIFGTAGEQPRHAAVQDLLEPQHFIQRDPVVRDRITVFLLVAEGRALDGLDALHVAGNDVGGCVCLKSTAARTTDFRSSGRAYRRTAAYAISRVPDRRQCDAEWISIRHHVRITIPVFDQCSFRSSPPASVAVRHGSQQKPPCIFCARSLRTCCPHLEQRT